MDDLGHEQAPPAPVEEAPPAQKLGRCGFLKLTSVSSAAAVLAACATPPPPTPTATTAPAAAATAVPPTAAPPTAAATVAPQPTAAAAAEPAAVAFVSDLLPYPRVKIATLGNLSSGAYNAAYPDPARSFS
jgi:hypothetical protein